MNKVNQNNIVELTETRQARPNELAQPQQALSFPINALILGSDACLQDSLGKILESISNLQVSFASTVTEQLNQYNLVILVVDAEKIDAKTWIEQLASQGANIILLGDGMDSDLIRTAIHYKVKDIISLAEVEQELLNTLSKCADSIAQQCHIAPVFTIMNGKSGSGASFISSCLGEISANLSSKEVALIDADLHYGSLADSLNLEPSYFLNNAIDDIDKLDNVAIKSMMAKRDNLSLLPSKPYSQLNPNESEYYSQLEQLVWKIKLNHDLVLVDLSRGLEPHTLPLITLSTGILIVLQQNIVSLRETKALVQQLTKHMGLPIESIHIIVNRYSAKVANITLADISKVLGIKDIYCVSNNYELASACSDCGSPILKLSDNKVIRKDICQIIEALFPIELKTEKTNFFSRLIRSS